MTLNHAQGDPKVACNLFERAFVGGDGYEHIDFARGECTIAYEGALALFL